SDLVNRHGKGRFVVTLDPGREQADKPPYQGIVPFEGDTVAEVLEHYMQRSEQIPSRLWLASDGECASRHFTVALKPPSASLSTTKSATGPSP
ncbi:MAG: redox-regulated molecular chaperone Hsp33, partial [Betaproteobacteria bacterium]|nr:redox-regulated molecular chaperone Hsp33 [Betaproteobacteria bacterium]